MHELGHWLEDLSPDVLKKALAFYDRRTTDPTTGIQEPLIWLGTLTGNTRYKRSEKARKDKFIRPYMGKIYIEPITGERLATEIVSMGLEYFYSDPYELARLDPDYFDFIFDLLRGR